MKGRYQWTAASAVVELFDLQPKRQRERLLRIFNQLAADPYMRGEYTQADKTGRPCEVKQFGEWIVTFWPEHLSKEIHVIALRQLRIS